MTSVDFYQHKSDMVEPSCVKFNKWHHHGVGITKLCMDNAGENKILKERLQSSDWKLPINVEFTARDTPQQNSPVEVKQATIFNCASAKLNYANVPYKLGGKFFPSTAKTAAHEDGLALVEENGVLDTHFKHILGTNPGFAKHLKPWGAAGVVKIKTKTSPKLNNKGVTCMFVGYATEHAGDVYYMYNPKINSTLVSCDVVWLNQMFYSKEHTTELHAGGLEADPLTFTLEDDEDSEAGKGNNNEAGKGPNYYSVLDDDDESDPDLEDYHDANEDEDDEHELLDPNESDDDDMPELQEPTLCQSTHSNFGQHKSVRFADEQAQEILQKHIQSETGMVSFMAPQDLDYVDSLFLFSPGGIAGSLDIGELACVGASIGGGFINTQELHVMKYDEAMAGPDAVHWSDAVVDEHDCMVANKVFKTVSHPEVPPDATILTSTWTMKKKANGTFHAHVNAHGFEQIDGEHYDSTSKAAPVVNEITIVMVLIMIVMAGWWAELLDVKSAFLHGTFDPKHKMYMYVPQGFEQFYPGDVVLLLLKTLYGTCQAAYAF